MPDTGSSNWVLTDWHGNRSANHIGSRVPIESAEHLKATLARFARQDPRILVLESPNRPRVVLAIGGSLAAVEVFRPTDTRRSFLAVTEDRHRREDRGSADDWQALHIPPRYLLPIAEVIAIVLDIYEAGGLPGRVVWEG